MALEKTVSFKHVEGKEILDFWKNLAQEFKGVVLYSCNILGRIDGRISQPPLEQSEMYGLAGRLLASEKGEVKFEGDCCRCIDCKGNRSAYTGVKLSAKESDRELFEAACEIGGYLQNRALP